LMRNEEEHERQRIRPVKVQYVCMRSKMRGKVKEVVWARDADVDVERKGQNTSAYPFILGAEYGSIRHNTAAYGSIRQHTAAYVSTRQHTPAYVSIRQHTSAYFSPRQNTSAHVSPRQHTEVCEVKCEVDCKGGGVVWACDAYVEVERKSSGSYVSIRQHTSARSAYFSIRGG
jgi:hypothetical protein